MVLFLSLIPPPRDDRALKYARHTERSSSPFSYRSLRHPNRSVLDIQLAAGPPCPFVVCTHGIHILCCYSIFVRVLTRTRVIRTNITSNQLQRTPVLYRRPILCETENSGAIFRTRLVGSTRAGFRSHDGAALGYTAEGSSSTHSS